MDYDVIYQDLADIFEEEIEIDFDKYGNGFAFTGDCELRVIFYLQKIFKHRKEDG